MSIEQVLNELEPVFKSEGDLFSFLNITYQEGLTAKQFAEEIKSGKLTVKEAWENYWSYKIDFKPMGITDISEEYRRAFLQEWRKMILLQTNFLDRISCEKIIDEGLKSFVNFNKKYFQRRESNPFIEDMLYISLFAGKSNISKEKHQEITNCMKGLVDNVMQDHGYQVGIFTALLFTKSDSSYELLDWYLSNDQLDNSRCFGGEYEVYTFSMFIRQALVRMNTPRMKMLHSNHSGIYTGGEFTDRVSQELRLVRQPEQHADPKL
jgi:hypothetical protein